MILGSDLPTSVLEEEENKPLASHLHQSARMKQNINIASRLDFERISEQDGKRSSFGAWFAEQQHLFNVCAAVSLARSLHSSNFPRMFALWVFPANFISLGAKIRFVCQSDKEECVGLSATYVILGIRINEILPHPVAVQCFRRG